MLRCGPLPAAAGVPALDIAKPLEPFAHQQAAPALAGLVAGSTIDQRRHANTQSPQPHQGIAFAQHGGPTKRMTQTAVKMPDLAFDVEHAPLTVMQALHPAFSSTALIGLFDPFALSLPPMLERRRGGAAVSYCFNQDHPSSRTALTAITVAKRQP